MFLCNTIARTIVTMKLSLNCEQCDIQVSELLMVREDVLIPHTCSF